MTFNPYLYTKGVFRPEEIALMRTTYRRIVRNEWFSASPDKRAEFARYIVRMYCRGMVIPEKLETLCLAAARARFSETFQGTGNMEGGACSWWRTNICSPANSPRIWERWAPR